MEWRYSFTLVLDGGDWSMSHSSHFTCRKSAWYWQMWRLGEPQSQGGHVWRRENVQQGYELHNTCALIDQVLLFYILARSVWRKCHLSSFHRWGSFLSSKVAGAWRWSLPHSAKVKNEGAIPPLPYMALWHAQDSFTCTFMSVVWHKKCFTHTHTLSVPEMYTYFRW